MPRVPAAQSSALFPADWLALFRECASRAHSTALAPLGSISAFDDSRHLEQALAAEGLCPGTLDWLMNGNHDASKPSAVLAFLEFLCRAVVGGLAWFAPPCENWVWMSKSKHRRTKAHPEGNIYDSVIAYYNDIAVYVSKAWVEKTMFDLHQK